jgi:hypothetical protein
MKNLFLSAIFAIVAFTSNAQQTPYPPYSLDNIARYEKVLFNKYDIDYAGGWTRFLCVSGYVNGLDTETKASTKREYASFQKFNKNYFQQVPSKSPMFDMEFYLTGKEIESEFLNLVLRNSNNKVVGLYEKQVNDSDFNIKTIVIVEMYSEEGVDPEYDAIDHLILVQGFDNIYRVMSPADEFVNFGNIECLDCPAEF